MCLLGVFFLGRFSFPFSLILQEINEHPGSSCFVAFIPRIFLPKLHRSAWDYHGYRRSVGNHICLSVFKWALLPCKERVPKMFLEKKKMLPNIKQAVWGIQEVFTLFSSYSSEYQQEKNSNPTCTQPFKQFWLRDSVGQSLHLYVQKIIRSYGLAGQNKRCKIISNCFQDNFQ